MLQGVIFDLDGTLADTLPVAIGAFQHTFHEHTGRDYSPDEIRAMFGPSEEGILRRRTPEDFEAALHTYLQEYERRHAACPKTFDGLAEALEGLRQRDLRIGIVTGKGPASTEITLRVLGLASFFDGVETGAEAGAIKTEGIRRLLARWQVAPEHAAYLGDHPIDVRSAKEVGVCAVAAAWAPGTDVDALVHEAPDRVIRSIDELQRWLLTAEC